MLDRLEQVKARYDEITAQLADPEVVANQERLRALSKEHSDLTPVMRAYDAYRKSKSDLEGPRPKNDCKSSKKTSRFSCSLRIRMTAET
jgi:protein subunit release factor A